MASELINTVGPDTLRGGSEFTFFFPDWYAEIADLGVNDNDLLVSGSGGSLMYLTPGTDTLRGGSGYDEIETYASFDLRDGGRIYTAHIHGLAVDLRAGTYTARWHSMENGEISAEPVVVSSGRLSGIEKVYGSAGDDTMRGSDRTPVIWNGSPVAETFVSSKGNDLIDGRGGLDGVDYTYFDYEPGSLPGTITVNNSTGRAIDPWGHQDTLRGIEEFDFSDLSQVRFAGSAADETVRVWASTGGGRYDGKGGTDRIVFAVVAGAGTTTGIVADMVTGTARYEDGSTTTFKGFENVTGSRLDDLITGDGRANWIVGSDGNDTLYGMAGDDTLSGGLGRDVLEGGAGNDTILLSGATGAGPVRVRGFEFFTDRFDASALQPAISAVPGQRAEVEPSGLRYDLTVDGGNLLVKVQGGLGKSLAVLANGVARLNAALDDAMVETGAVVEVATGATGVQTIAGAARDDLLIGGNWGNVMSGGAGSDAMIGAEGNDELAGAAGNDIVAGLGEDDLLRGWTGDDLLFGGSGDDFLAGQDGNDTLVGGTGHDRLRGGAGADVFVLGPNDGPDENTLRDQVQDFQIGVDRLDLSAFGLTGAARDPATWEFEWRTSVVVVVRLPGVDGPAFELRGETVVRQNEAALKDAALYLFAPAAQDMAGGAENDQLVGSGGADLLEGLRGADLLTGAGGRDMLFGGAGSDTLDGGTGRDVLSGGEGRDSLSGGSGDDMLLGGAGADTLTGGNGADVFFFVQTDLAGATDRITDFELGTDRLAFDFDAASALSYQVGTNEVIVSLKDTGAQVVVLEIDRIDVALIEGGGLL